MSARDIAGRELKVGQVVAYCLAGQAQNMRLAAITRISPKTVELDAVAYVGGNNLRRAHDAVCAIIETHHRPEVTQ